VWRKGGTGCVPSVCKEMLMLKQFIHDVMPFSTDYEFPLHKRNQKFKADMISSSHRSEAFYATSEGASLNLL
jgi:hypothetical protein